MASLLAPGLALEIHRRQSHRVLQALWGLKHHKKAWTWQASLGASQTPCPPTDCRVGRDRDSRAICWACSPSQSDARRPGCQPFPQWPSLRASSIIPLSHDSQITCVRRTLKESSLLINEETEEQRGYGICFKSHSKLVAELGWFLCPRGPWLQHSDSQPL